MASRVAPFRRLLRPAIWHNNLAPRLPVPSTSSATATWSSHAPLYAKQPPPPRIQATWDDSGDGGTDLFAVNETGSTSSSLHASSEGHGRSSSRDRPPHLKSAARSSPPPPTHIDPTQLPLGSIPKPQKQVKFRPANKFGRPNRRRNKAPPPPPLPAVEPLPNVADLDPVHLSELRLWTLRRSGITPTDKDLQRNLSAWLIGAHKAKARAEHEEKRSRELQATKRDALDLSWEWDRQVAVKSGVERTDREKRRDGIVLRRLERRRLEKLQAAQDREQEKRAELDELIRRREDEARAKVDAAEREAEQKRQADEDEAKERLRNAPDWKKHQVALREQFPDGWAPPKRLSREAMDLIRTMHAANPTQYSTAALADQFKVSPEAVRRILKSRFQLSKAEADRREAKRKEARKLEVAQGSSVWGGNVAAEAREMDSIRSGCGPEGDASRTT